MDSFDDLFQRYSKDVFRFLFKLCGYNQTLAEDLMQDTFLYVYLGLSDFRSECPIKTWILQIAKNRYFLYLRNKKHSHLEDRKQVNKHYHPWFQPNPHSLDSLL